ncbi:MAG: hypothetical protein NC251_11680, partial [Lachnoclostridium sp.]|nr:hypothetical protein [Lachnospira sp.]MCM1249077.1 hypothetical protein [Lachnoclostridium sp.]
QRLIPPHKWVAELTFEIFKDFAMKLPALKSGGAHGIIILLAQNPSQLTLPCPHKAKKCFVRHYTKSHCLKSKCPCGALPFLRLWYNDSAIAESKSACAALPSQSKEMLCEALYGAMA